MKIYFFQLLVLITILTSCKNSNKIPSSLAEFDQTEKLIIDKLAVQQAQAVNDTVIKKETKKELNKTILK